MTREEAIDRIKRLDFNSVDREALYTIIPELRESDDERIRKMLVELVKKHLVNHERCMAESWLEKQKCDGKKWIYEDDYDKDIERSFNDGKNEVLENPEKYGLQKEQTSKIIIPKFHIGEYIKPKPYNEKHLIKNIDENGYVLDVNFVVPFKDEDVWEVVEQNPVEWSDEDKEKIDHLSFLLTLAEISGHITAPKRTELGDFLIKNLRPQSKREWSEEDEAHRNFILESLEDQIRFCKKDAEGAYYAKQIRAAQNWLKSLHLNKQD